MDKDTDDIINKIGNSFSDFAMLLAFAIWCFTLVTLCGLTLNSIVTKTISTQCTIQLTEPIQQDNLSYVTIAKNASEARYINNNGEEVAIPLANDCRIFHRTGKQNKVSYKISKEYNIFNKKVCEYATKVTIYKALT